MFVVQSQATADIYSTVRTNFCSLLSFSLLITLIRICASFTQSSRQHDVKFCKRVNGEGEVLLVAAEDKKFLRVWRIKGSQYGPNNNRRIRWTLKSVRSCPLANHPRKLKSLVTASKHLTRFPFPSLLQQNPIQTAVSQRSPVQLHLMVKSTYMTSHHYHLPWAHLKWSKSALSQNTIPKALVWRAAFR